MSHEDGNGFFAIDGPLMRTMELVINMLLLNILVIICSVPVITIGAAFTAMYHQLQRMMRNEDGYVVRDFFKDFASNFKVSTITWLILLPIGAFLGIDLKIFSDGVSFPGAYKWLIIAFTVIYIMGLVYVFPVLARYETTPKLAIKNAYAMSLFALPKTILMIAFIVLPWIGAMYIANFVLVCGLFGISLPAYFNTFLCKKTFETFERKQQEALEESSEDPNS
ncbi:MAG: YesL family protein [Lachnospiraceae bacterium]|nr:YesL family protein [Lachnospiraceae bacterium]